MKTRLALLMRHYNQYARRVKQLAICFIFFLFHSPSSSSAPYFLAYHVFPQLLPGAPRSDYNENNNSNLFVPDFISSPFTGLGGKTSTTWYRNVTRGASTLTQIFPPDPILIK